MGFFSKDEVQTVTNPSQTCAKCGLYKNCHNPRMESYGDGKLKILNIGESPGLEEDKKGKPWQGKSGRYLKQTYRKFGINLFKDCKNINSVNCKPSNNKSPTKQQIQCCRSRVISTIKEFNPHIIILLGNAAIESILDIRYTNRSKGITTWRGQVIPDRRFDAWICPIFHPSHIIRNDEKHIKTVWKNDIKRIKSLIDKPLPDYENEENQITIIDDLKPLESFNPDYMCFDYETTGLKPDRKGHRIVTAAVSDGDRTYSFMMPKTKKGRKPFLDLLADPSIKKVAHNMKYENIWSKVRLNQEVVNWGWDSMLAAHLLDNRSGTKSMDFQVYTNFGVGDYSSDIKSYLKSNSKDSNAFNKVKKLVKTGGKKDLLIYNGLDSLFGYKLAKKQMKEVKYG